jgi:uncharacterized SAM-binding protein YcdF (DUF218 family)
LIRWGYALGALVLAVVVAAAALVVYVLPRDDAPATADVVVVLGGAGGDRAELGIELAERFDAPLVLSSSASIFGERQGRDCDVDAICFEPTPANTAGEAANIARMAAQQGWDHVVVATSSFHTSRSRFLFGQCLGEDRVSVIGRTAEGHRDTNPQLVIRESLGVIAGATFARAC